jgi:prepilin-type N-terminal cleavage/methylation domain-containing protein
MQKDRSTILAVPPAPTFSRGFTLTEMAVVLVIVGLLIGGMVMPMSAQQDIRYVSETETTLKNIHEALLGFAAANGRLPCPAAPAGNGIESFAAGDASGGECSNFLDGFLPAATLGIQPTDTSGFAIDAWGRRIRYAVTDKTIKNTTISRAITRTDGIKLATINNVAATAMLAVCSTATGITPGDITDPIQYCGAAPALVTSTPAVIFSTGKNGAGTGTDEQANSTTADTVFVSHVPTPSSVTNGEFDDIVLWISPNVLFNRMITAGRLP